MATLPNDDTSLGTVQTQKEPSRTWLIDKDTNRIRGECDGYKAVKQAVEIILNTIRFRWGIYDPSSGIEYDNLIGLDPGYVAIELQQRIIDALSVDTRVTGVTNFDYTAVDGELAASFTVTTVYGDLNENVEVSLE